MNNWQNDTYNVIISSILEVASAFVYISHSVHVCLSFYNAVQFSLIVFMRIKNQSLEL